LEKGSKEEFFKKQLKSVENYVGKLKSDSRLMIQEFNDDSEKESRDNDSKTREIEKKISALKESMIS